jgi:GNAT superfamily N-acetyltransferase
MVDVREARMDDLPALISLYEQLQDIGEVPSEVYFSADDVELTRQMIWRTKQYPDYKLYVGQVEGKVVASLALLVLDSVPNGIPYGILEHLVVERACRSRGIGTQLIKFAVDVSREKGCRQLFVWSGLQRTDAHRFYQAVGFEQHGYIFVANL